MKLSSVLTRSTSFVKKLRFILFFYLGFLSTDLGAHGTQVEYCFTNNNMVRVYIEHWHGNVTDFSQSIVNMTITADGVATTMNVPASGFVHDTPQGMLPDCSAPTIQISECTNVADVYNDWAYFDFPAPDCFQSLVIRINSVIDPTFVLLECGASRGGPIYPASTPVITRTDDFAPFIVCEDELPDLILGCNDAIPMPQEISTIDVTDDCTDTEDIILNVSEVDGTMSCTGNGIIRTYTFTDDDDKSTECEQQISYADDSTPPRIMCPADLRLACDDPNAESTISDWLETYRTSDDCSTNITVTNTYSESGFAYQDVGPSLMTGGVLNLGSFMMPAVTTSIVDNYLSQGRSEAFLIKETSNKNQYDKLIKTRLYYQEGMAIDFSDVLIVDVENRVLPIGISELEPGVSMELTMKVPELKAGQDNSFKVLYGKCHSIDVTMDSSYDLGDDRSHLIISPILSNIFSEKKEDTEQKSKAIEAPAVVMDCNCTASQGGVSFPINAIQNPRDDVEFYIFGNSGTSQAASSNTGFECNDQVVMFLYENTLTGEISLFVIIDAAGGGNGGRGSIDFFCLPATATVDHSDDNGEITGLFPTVMANWRWADCCTDGVVIGNVGCDQTFDFVPQFVSGINSIKWVSGTPTAPVFNTFPNITDPIRISCGDSNPSCCPNTNQVSIINATCPSDNDGSINVTPDPAGGPYAFEWSTGATTEDISNLSPGDYTVTILDDNDCEQITTFTVDVETKPDLICDADQVVLMGGTMVTLEEGLNVMYTLDYNCADDTKIDCSGCGDFDCDDQNSVQLIALTVSDELGNTDQCTINVTIQNTAPDIVCPSDLTIGCIDPAGEDLIETWITTARVRDPEGGMTVVDNTYDDAGFSFTDEDGPQKVSGKQSIQSEPKDYYLRLVESYSMMMPIPSSGTQTVTFTATDACGNTSTCTADIIIVDNTDPIIDCPSDITVECGDPNNDAIIVNWLDNASADDTCDENFIDITNNFTALSANACGGETTVTFTATDSAGNRAQCRSTITHEDTTPPEFLMKPQNLVAECINSNGAQPEINAWAAAMGNGMAIDDCDPDVRWSFVIDGQEETCGHTYIRTYTFTITDNCGNTASSTATATVVDETPPVLNLRADITVNCSAANPTQLMTFIDAFGSTSDLCTDGENILVENVLFNSISGCGGTSTETYLFTATDECGNSTTGFWNFTIQDIAIPTWVNPPGTLFLECGDEDNPTLIQEWLADVEASTVDACGAVHTVTNNWDGNLPDDNCNSNTAVTFTVVDDCGNVRTNLVRSIRVRDLTNPVIVNCPEDFTVNVDVDNCSSNVVFSTPVGFDQCTDIVTINQTIGPASGSEFPVGTTRIVFEAIDDCGRRSNPDCDFNITVVDSDTPSVSCPSNVDACVPAGSCTWRSDDTVLPMSADNCDRVVTQVEITGATTLTRRTGTAANRVFQLGTSTVCYYVTDAAGNESTCCFDVVVTDCTAPTIMCPEDITVACEESTSTTGPSGNLVYDHNQNAGQSYAAANNISSVISSANDITFGPGLQLLDDGFNPAMIPNGSTFEHILTGAATNTFTAAEAADDYVEICFSTSCAGVITQIQQGIIPGPNGSAAGNYMIAAAISNDGFLSSSILYQDAFLPDPNVTNSYALYQESLDFALAAGQTYKIRYYLYNEQNNITPNTTVAFDDLFIDITKITETGNGAALTDWLADVSASDNCPGGVTITSSLFNTISGCGDANSNVYEFTAVDVDGNTSTCQSSFTIEDTVAPEITTAATNGDSDCENANADLLDWLNNFGFAEASDACGDITWSHDFEGGAMTGCSGVTALMVTFTATDDCGNTATTQANFEVNDTEAPTLTCPVDITLECGDVLNEAVTELWLQSAVASDNCTAVDITNNYPTGFVADCGSTGATTVTFTAMDGCDNGERCEATIVIEDSTAPVLLVAPQDLVVECGPSAVSPADWLESNGGAVATDQCDADLVWTVAIGSTTPGCGDSQTIEYIFTVTDVCGNATSASALYIFEDTLLPTVVPPADITVECGAITTSVTEWQDGARAADDCGSGFTFEAILFNTVSGCGESMTEVYQFTATDACGNQATALASYTIVDTTEPSVSCPSVLALECGSELNDLLIIEWLDSPEGADGCGDVTFEDNYAGTLPVNCGGRLQVVFTGMDACGNEATCTSSITMDDTGLPDFVNCPDDLTINVDVDECGSNPIFSTPVAVDNCSVMVVQTEGIASGNTFPVGTTAIEFTATDECGNTALCQFDLTVEDSDVPLVLCPSNTVVACADEGLCIWSSEDVGPTLGLENCENSTLVYTITGTTTGSGADDASGTLFALGASTICYTLTDASGNASSCCFDVLVEDCQAPGLTCPADLVVECDGLGNASDVSAFLAGASGSDNCQDQPVITNEFFNTISECGGGETTVYQFTATDEAGNTTLCTASMRIIDRVIPELTTPAVDLTVECTGGAENNSAFIAWLNNNGGATATDVCSDIVWSHNFTEELTDLCGSTGARTVTFTARDACDNLIMTTAVFRIRDSEDPLLVCPQPIVLECNDPANEAIISNWLASASATDACSEVEIAYVFPDVFTADCGDTGEHTVTFEAADECGNDTNCVSTIRLEDNIDPVFDLRPSNLMLECADPNNANLVSIWLANNGGGIASDLCSTPVWMVEEISEIPSCGSTSETVYLFTITDDCNNTNTAFASVITENTTAPILSTPTELTVECDGSNNLTELNDWLALADGSSDCGSVSIENQLFNTISDCGGSSEQVYLFTATDQCGNQSTALSSFIIEDTTDPTPVCPPTLVLECGDEGNDQAIAAWLLSTDITDGSGCSEVILSNNYNGNLPTLLCSGNPGTIVQFTATDACGNSQSCQALITINDTTAPLFANCPTDITVNVDVDLCSSNVVYSQPVALDQCDLDIDIALTSGLASGTTFPLGTTAILFTAMDECGNGTTCTFNITVEDSDIPEIDCPSNRVVVCTTDGTCMWEANEETSAIFSENCEGAGFTITYAITGATTANSSPTGLNDVDSDNVIFNLGVSEVCYTITDEAGNSDQCCFDLVVEDCQDPEIVCPADLVVECDGAGNSVELADWLESVTGTDNCDASVELSSQMFNTISGCGDTQSEIYAFTVTDDFGNTNLCYAEFRIEDTTVPTIDIEAVDLTLECNGTGSSAALTAWLNNQAGAMASDLCGEISWTHNFVQELDVICDGNSTTTVTFTATDNCGNESTTTAVFTIEDTVVPVVVCPEDITLECAGELNAELIANWLNRASATDECSSVTLVDDFGNVFTGACGSTGVHTVTFTATDGCNNLSACERTVTIVDESSPQVILAPVDLVLECSNSDNTTEITNWEMNFGGAVATDPCSEPLVWSIVDRLTFNDCGSTSRTEYTFHVEDACGNLSTTSASVIIEDTTPPELIVPSDQLEECNSIAVSLSDWREEVTGSDTCGEVTFTSVLWNTTSGCGGTESMTYLFTATDACGNSTTGFAEYSIEDTTVPEINCPENLALVCGDENNDQNILAWLNSATAIDLCSAVADCSNEFIEITAANLGLTAGDNQSVNNVDVSAVYGLSPGSVLVSVSGVNVSSAGVFFTEVGDAPQFIISGTQPVYIRGLHGAPISGRESDCITSLDGSSYTFTTPLSSGFVQSGVAPDYCVDRAGGANPHPGGDFIWESTSPATGIQFSSTSNGNSGYKLFLSPECSPVISEGTSSDVSITSDFPSSLPDLTCDGGTGTPITFTATDECGNSSSCVSTITMDDVEAPYFSNCPLDMIVNVDVDLCETNVVYSQPIALDDCDENVDVAMTSGIASGAAFPIGTTTILFTATDDCGNTSTCEFAITVLDSDVPSIECPSNEVVVCTDTDLCTWEATSVSSSSFADNCAEQEGYTVTYTVTGATTATSPTTGINDVDEDDVVFNLGTSEICYTITDAAGNSDQCCFDLVVEDCQDPEIVCPADLVVECDGVGNSTELATWLGSVGGADNCATEVELTNRLFNTISGCGETQSEIYAFTVTDDFGNTSICYAEFRIEDTTVPTIDIEAADLTLECNGTGSSAALTAWLNNQAGAMASDLCGEISWSHNFVQELDVICEGNSTTTVTFTATDNCGNESTTTAVFTIEDTVDPFIVCPEDITLECAGELNDELIANWLDRASAEDGCSGVTLVNNFGELFAAGCGSTGVHNVIFTAEDACNNLSVCEGDVTIMDESSPEIISEPIDLILECAGTDNATDISNWETSFGGAVATDACSSPLIWTIISTSSLVDCGSTSSSEYTFQVTDDCGNTSTTTASVIIEDTTPPELVVPEDQVEECNAIAVSLEEWRAEVTGSDACGAVAFTSVLWNTTSGCGGTESLTYLFTATDACGNSSTGFASYGTEDTQVPTPVCPANLLLTCGSVSNDQQILSWLNSASATDAVDCSEFNITNDYPGDLPELNCNGGVGIEINFIATDACGNSASCSSTITMEDNTPPIFSNCPLDMMVNVDVDLCSTNVVYSQPIALDACDAFVEVALIEGVPSGMPFPLGLTTVTFESIDECGNTSICTFDITVVDSDVPSIACPSNDVVVCTDSNSCTWIATDQIDPIYNDNCPGQILTYNITGATTAMSGPTGVNEVDAGGEIFILGRSTVLYTITDPEGNVASCEFDVVVEDCEDPTLTCVDVLEVACDSEDLSAWFNTIAASIMDNCSAEGEMVVDTLLLTDFSSCGNTFDRVYQYRVTDAFGNFSQCIARYETIDEVVPDITDATDLTVECADGSQSTALLAWLNNNGGATATDVCSEPITWTNDFVNDLSIVCGSNGRVEVVFTATDDCGNFSTTSAVFTIEDTTAPVLTCPDDISLECSEDINVAVINNWLRTATALDACQGITDIVNNYPGLFAEGCGLTGVHTVTFATSDDCGSLSSCQREIIFLDRIAPEIIMEAEDLELSCSSTTSAEDIALWLANNAGAEATDACSDEVLVWTFEEIETSEGCGGFSNQTYVFTVTDNCGNTSTTEAMVVISDDTHPDFDLGPQDLTINCDPMANAVSLEDWLTSNGGAIVSDECASNFTWTYDLVSLSDDCGNTSVQTYRFTVSDECGNSSTAEADFVTTDAVAPVITKEAENFTAECNGSSNSAEILSWLNNNGFATAEDLCGSITWTNDYGTVLTDCGTAGGVTVIFTATDECGNSSTTSAVFTINDTTDPIWTLNPQSIEVECDGSNDPMGQIEAWLNTAGGGEAEDDCSAISYTHNFSAIDLECDMEGGVEVMFTVTDACGNFSTATTILTITDDVPPIFTTQAANQSVECDGSGNLAELQAWLDANGGAVAQDGCSADLTWAYVMRATIGNCGMTQIATYDFTATDACGNVSANTTAAFIIEDTTMPVFDRVPTNLVVECDGAGNRDQLVAWLDDNGTGLASDICGAVSWTWDLVTEQDKCGDTGDQVYRFTLTDACGNTNTAEASFTIEDTTIPVLASGADELLEDCSDDFNGDILQFDAWLTNNAGATASDICGQITWSNDYVFENWVTTCGNTQYVDVTFTATDNCGNSDSTTHRFGVGDISAPTFVNCPRPPVVVDAPDTWCSAFVNFAEPVAEDNCSDFTIEQVDNTGLGSGDLFDVGLTILSYVATDQCGNTSTCELKIIVNDFHTPPSITCGGSMTVDNDPSMCGAIVDGIAPLTLDDNCLANLSVVYEVLDADGILIYSGFDDASGLKFPTGANSISYTVTDQPLLLITELVQDGVSSGVEIANFGPGSLDISCLDISRIGNSEETFNVPNGTVLPVGGVYTQAFGQINPAASAGYYISFLDKIIDGVSINGYVSSIYDFGGSVFGENVYRNQVSDRDGAVDFVVADACFTGSYGEFNPSLPVMPDNGIGSSLQQAEPSIASCFFNVIVVDNEPAFCAAFDTTRYCLTSELIAPNTCTQYTFDVPGGITVGEINLRDLIVTHNQVGDLGFSLTSPAGTTVQLFDALCDGTSNVDISLDDQSSTALTSVSCDPLGGAASYQAFESLSAFFDEPATGSWTLNVYNNGNEEGTLESICLEILELRPYTQGDLVLSNDLGECSAVHTWQHPQIDENCGMASMTITFESDQNIALPPSGDVVPGEMTTEIFAVGTTRVIYTIEDAAGNKSICSFEVIVVDDEEPIIDLAFCQNQTIQLGPGECFVPVSALNLPPIIENCGSSNISFTPAIDAGLPSGDHPLVFALVDAFGNSSGCDFMVTVLPFEVPNGQLACLGQINLSLGADCEEQITADMILGPGQVVGCTEDYCVTVRDEDGNEVAGGVVNETHIGQVVIVEVCPDCNGGNCCWGEVLVEKKVTSIACPVSQISISCNQVFEPAVVGEPVVETCEQDLLFSYEDNFILGDMCDTAPGTIERTWYITDQNNNVQQCLQVITIVGFDINEVNFPADTILTTDLITCEDIAADEDLLHPDHTGWPDLNGVAINITGDGLCSHFWGWEDTKLYNCEGSYEILRQWLVRDMCDPVDFGTNPIIYYQSIKVLDNMPPQFTGCDHGTIAAPANFDCNTEIYLNDYFPEITDLCGSVKDTLISVTPGAAIERPVGSGQYYLTNMAPGTHTVKITVGDQCSNINRCEFDINVIDQTGPNVACEQDVHVSLNSVGLTEFPAEILDDGSFDNCTAVEFQVYRMDDNCGNPSDLEPGAYVSLCCADVTASPINLMLRVWDDADNNGMFGTTGDFFSECMVRVNVSNATTPSLSCPPSIELACNADYTNLNLTGQPTLGSACNFVDAEFADDISDLNSCNTGEVIRTWNIIGQNIECEQVIHIESAMPFTENDIVWPQNVEGDCSVMTTAHQPLVSTLSCSQIGIDVASDTFFFTENACYKVINEWTVIDWCQYDGTTTPPQGIWEYTQTITVTSTEAPVITGCGDLIVDLENDDCSALDVPVSNTATSSGCASGSDLSWSYEIDYDADGNSDMNGITSGAVSNITLMEVDELGATILWTAIDGCGNTDACTQFVTVRDGKNPLAYCNSIAVATMEVNGAVEVWVSDVDAGSTDNCTATSDLVLSFDAATTVSNVSFSCADIPNGISEDVQVTLFITDEAGNQSNCTTTISLQDNADACPDQVQTPIMIAGIIKTEDGAPLQAVQTQIVDGAMLVEEMNVTDTTGGFEFTDVQINGNYRITPSKSGGFLDGLSTFDLILIQRHILGAAILDSPYKIIAADVTRNDKVNGQDLIELRKLLLTHIDSFATGDSWRFVPENFVFQNPTSPFPIEEDIVISSVQDSMMHNDFIGVKLGDVDGSFVVNLDDQELSTRSIYNIHYTIESNEEASTYLMPVFSTDLDVIYGFQLGLQLNQGQVLDILPGSVTLKEENYKMLDAQTIAISWNEVEGAVTNLNAPLFYLKVADIDVASFEIELLTEMPQAEIYLTESLTTKVPVLSLYEEVDEEQDFELYQNDPNPFKDWTTIDFYLPTAQDVTMSFYTPDGALIHSVKGHYPEGRSSLKIEASDLGAQNVIIYRLSSDFYTSSKKMILVK